MLLAELQSSIRMLKRIGVLLGLLHLLSFSNSEIISTNTGNISGTTIKVLGQDVEEYLGIRYAEPPLGKLRFKPPVPVKPWKGLYNATQNPPPCMQIGMSGTEDCLFINIWVPKNTTEAVMVWFHGGGFMFGSINKNDVDGSIISSVGGVIFASVSYRLGPFGLMCSETDDARGNMGLKDQVLGLRWIKDNIKAFGGDSSKITIFGQSAGAMSVSTHLVSPLTKNLFKSAIMQSGSAYNPYVPVRNTSIVKWRSTDLAVMVGCASEGQDIATDPNVMICMRNKSASFIITAETIVIITSLISETNPWLSLFTPIYGDDYLPKHPIEEMAAGNIHVDSFMIGTVTDEGSSFLWIFADLLLGFLDRPITTKWKATSYIRTLFRGLDNPPSEKVVDYYLANTSFLDGSLLKRSYDSVGDWVFDCPCVFLSESSYNNGKKVRYYIFNHRSSISSSREWMGVAHGAEEPFIFGLPLINGSSYTSEEKEFSRELIGAWTSFAKEEKPVYDKLSGEWPMYDGSRRAVVLNPYNVSFGNPYKDACRFWKDYF